MVDPKTIHPFIGYRSWEHDPVNGRPKTMTTCDMDYSGTKTYSFNRSGFRGEDFDPDAARYIFFSGCSYTFGTGLNYEETAAARFKALYSEGAELDPADVNLLNFAMPGASNDYIVRTMITQCERVRPDVAVVMFTHTERAEYIDEEQLGEKVWTVGPWWIREAVYPHIKPPDKNGKKQAQVLRDASIGYFHYSTRANALSRFLKNALLLQFYFQEKKIPFVLHWVEFNQLDYVKDHFALSPMNDLLKKDHFVNYADTQKYWCDKAADGAHPGPVSNTNIANALFETYKSIYAH